MSTIIFPEWLTEGNKPNEYRVNIDILYQLLLDEISTKAKETQAKDGEANILTLAREMDPNKPDQYWLEVIFQCAKLETQRILILNSISPWGREFHFDANDKTTWQQSLRPAGRGTQKATQGLEAKAVYIWLRGGIPN